MEVQARVLVGLQECKDVVAKYSSSDRKLGKLLGPIRELGSKGFNARVGTIALSLAVDLLGHLKNSSESILPLAKDQKSDERKVVRIVFLLLSLVCEHVWRITQDAKGRELISSVFEILHQLGDTRQAYLPRKAIALRTIAILSAKLNEPERIEEFVGPLATSWTAFHSSQQSPRKMSKADRKSLGEMNYLSPTVFSALRLGLPLTAKHVHLIQFGWHSQNCSIARQALSFASAAACFAPVEVAAQLADGIRGGYTTADSIIPQDHQEHTKRLRFSMKKTSAPPSVAKANLSDGMGIMHYIRACVTAILRSNGSGDVMSTFSTKNTSTLSPERRSTLFDALVIGLENPGPKVKLFAVTQCTKFDWAVLKEQQLMNGKTLVDSVVDALLGLWSLHPQATSSVSGSAGSSLMQHEFNHLPMNNPVMRYTWCKAVSQLMEACTRHHAESHAWSGSQSWDTPDCHKVLQLVPHLSQLVHQHCNPPVSPQTRLLAMRSVVWLPGESTIHEQRTLDQLEYPGLDEESLSQVIRFVEDRSRLSPSYARVLLGFLTRYVRNKSDTLSPEMVLGVLRTCVAMESLEVKGLVLNLVFGLLDSTLTKSSGKSREWKADLIWFLGEYAHAFVWEKEPHAIQVPCALDASDLPVHLRDVVRRLLLEIHNSDWFTRKICASALGKTAIAWYEPFRFVLYKIIQELDSTGTLGIHSNLSETVLLLDEVYESLLAGRMKPGVTSPAQQLVVKKAKLVSPHLPNTFLF